MAEARGWGRRIRALALDSLTFVNPAFYALSTPAFRSTTPRLVPPDKLPAAAALDMVRTQTGQIAGPALGDLEAGVVAALTSVRFSLVSGGIASIVGVGLLALALPQFHRYRSARPPHGSSVGPHHDDNL
jgi:hypothetical protein